MVAAPCGVSVKGAFGSASSRACSTDGASRRQRPAGAAVE